MNRLDSNAAGNAAKQEVRGMLFNFVKELPPPEAAQCDGSLEIA
jgi:hypothetical protein